MRKLIKVIGLSDIAVRKSRFVVFVDADLIQTIRPYKDVEGHRIPGFETLHLPSAEASGTRSEIHVTADRREKVVSQLGPNFLSVTTYSQVEPYRQTDGLHTGEGICKGPVQIVLNLSHIQSVSPHEGPLGPLPGIFVIRLAGRPGEADELCVSEDHVRIASRLMSLNMISTHAVRALNQGFEFEPTP
jgi:hypothetical protein